MPLQAGIPGIPACFRLAKNREDFVSIFTKDIAQRQELGYNTKRNL